MGDDWGHRALGQRTRGYGVVKSLPIGMKFDRSQGPRLQKFMRPIAEQWLRIIRPGGFVLCFSQNRLVHHAAMAIESRYETFWLGATKGKPRRLAKSIRRRKIGSLPSWPGERCRS